MPDLPKLEDQHPPTESETPTPETIPPQTDPPVATVATSWLQRFPSVGSLLLTIVLAAAMLYGIAGFLRVTGIYDVRQWWSAPADAPSLAAISNATVPPPAPQKAPATEGYSGPLRDQPPRTAPANLPQFTVRDGEQYDFLTDLDAETLKRLAEVQGQLDGLTTLVGNLNQGVQVLARNAGQQRQLEATHQHRMQQELVAARQEIATLQTTVEDVEARLKRARGGTYEPGGSDSVRGRALTGWSVKAISGNRAWLRTPKGREVTVTAGERLKTLGAVRAVDTARGIVVMSDGRYMQ